MGRRGVSFRDVSETSGLERTRRSAEIVTMKVSVANVGANEGAETAEPDGDRVEDGIGEIEAGAVLDDRASDDGETAWVHAEAAITATAIAPARMIGRMLLFITLLTFLPPRCDPGRDSRSFASSILDPGHRLRR
jgi:hypothetical protein